MEQHERLREYLKKYAVGHKNGKTKKQMMDHLFITDERVVRELIHFLRTEEKLVIVACPTEGLGYFIPDKNDQNDIRYTEIFVKGNKSRQDELEQIIYPAENFLKQCDGFLPI